MAITDVANAGKRSIAWEIARSTSVYIHRRDHGRMTVINAASGFQSGRTLLDTQSRVVDSGQNSARLQAFGVIRYSNAQGTWN